MGEPAIKLELQAYDMVVRDIETEGKPHVVVVPDQLLGPVPFEVQIPWEINAMAARKGFLEQALPVGVAGVVGTAIIGVFAWGFSMLHGDLGDLRKGTNEDIGEIRGEVRELRADIREIGSDVRDAGKQIATLSAQQGITNQKLDDLIAVTREKQKGL
jgi:hypothetical protein